MVFISIVFLVYQKTKASIVKIHFLICLLMCIVIRRRLGYWFLSAYLSAYTLSLCCGYLTTVLRCSSFTLPFISLRIVNGRLAALFIRMIPKRNDNLTHSILHQLCPVYKNERAPLSPPSCPPLSQGIWYPSQHPSRYSCHRRSGISRFNHNDLKITIIWIFH